MTPLISGMRKGNTQRLALVSDRAKNNSARLSHFFVTLL